MSSSDDAYARLFRRHAHPFSAWSRLLTTPLLLVPLWTRRGWLYLSCCAWFTLNPVITPPARNPSSSFATRALLGEESWTRDPMSEPKVLVLTGVATGTLIGTMVAAYQRSKTGTAVGTGIFIALTLWEWKLWADRLSASDAKVL